MSINRNISEAAFRHAKTGQVYATGPFHNIDRLPQEVDLGDLEDGFVTNVGSFVTRSEATKLMRLNRPVQSEELALSLQKTLSQKLQPYAFEGPTLEGSHYKITAKHGEKPVGEFTFWAKPVTDANHPHVGWHRVGGTHVSAMHRGRGINAKMMMVASKFIKNNLKGKGLVSEGAWREDAATNSWLKMSNHIKGVKKLRSKSDPDTLDFRLSEDEGSYKHPDEADDEFVLKFKQWLYGRSLEKNEANSLNGIFLDNNLWGELTDEDHDMAAQMASFCAENTPEYNAARFLTGGKEPSHEKIREALVVCDSDFELAMLTAFDLPRTEASRKLLQGIVQTKALNKNEPEMSTPQSVEPAVTDSLEVAEALKRAFDAKLFRPVHFPGKHSRGMAIAKDPDKGTKFLIKPGSGPPSPALGVNEEPASQARREVAFAKLSRCITLGRFVPAADLIVIDGKEVAAIHLLPGTYIGLDKKGQDFKTLMRQYIDDGTLFKWAIMDYLFANPDRHAGNIMANGDGHIKLIDHGSAMAGPSFNPAHDNKSFVPFYLRAFSPENFKRLTPKARLNIMPRPSRSVNKDVSDWIDGFSAEKIESVCQEYGINAENILRRVKTITSMPEDARIEWVLSFYAGLVSEEI